MSLWEKFKDIIPIKLADIKFQLTEGNVHIGDKIYNVYLPQEADRSMLQGIAVTQEWEREYAEKLRKQIEKQEKHLS